MILRLPQLAAPRLQVKNSNQLLVGLKAVTVRMIIPFRRRLLDTGLSMEYIPFTARLAISGSYGPLQRPKAMSGAMRLAEESSRAMCL